eukprot:TRINITY_DN16824_c0_g1_i1.p1 TRINITY_DN16824_c0_g1~~TRINITY_DN16824_c0_g1_i1.p1  ORF type:complete len:291 (-),score=65.71 TRINITY_DN16824_c0_g1_i1:238-1110(-)
MEGPPKELLDFLGEAPSELALRRPGSRGGTSQASASRPVSSRGREEAVAFRPSSAATARDEDSSPETPGRPPRYDGGFDEYAEVDGVAPTPETEPLPAKKGNAEQQRSQQQPQQRSLPPRAPGGNGESGGASPAGSSASGAGGASMNRRQPSQSGVGGATPSSGGSRGRRSSSTPTKPQSRESDFSKTTTPVPASFTNMMEEGFTIGDEAPSQSRVSSGQSQRSLGRTRTSGYGGARGGTPPPAGNAAATAATADQQRAQNQSGGRSAGAGVAELDVLGSTARRRFGGRG